jgi:hypothetical protein
MLQAESSLETRSRISMFRERGETPLSAARDEADRLRQSYQSHFFPSVDRAETESLLQERR